MQRFVLPSVIVLGIVIAMSGPAAIVILASRDIDKLKSLDSYLLPILLIGGIVMFLVALCVVVIVFRKLGLANTGYALGLPEGSIRAFIALALILLFFMMGIYLYTGISKPDQVLTGLTTEQAADIPRDRVAFLVPKGPLVDVHLNPSSGGEDVARQMITTMSTLVVAISSFYFGTSSVQQALGSNSGGTTTETPSLVLLAPQNLPRRLRRKGATGWEPETIKLRCTPAEARIDVSVEGDERGPAATDDSGLYTYVPNQPRGAKVALKFFLTEHSEIVQTVTYEVPPDAPPAETGAAAASTAAPPEEALPDETLPDETLPEEPLPEEPLPEKPLPDGKPPAPTGPAE